MPTHNLAHNIKQLRHKNGWNQEDVAKQLDISIPALSKIETGITDLNLSRLEQISKLFKVNIIELLTGDSPIDVKEIARLKDLLLKRDQEVIDLQRKIIELYKKTAV